jgi:putative nucleotidyltransferase with HDIG domain
MTQTPNDHIGVARDLVLDHYISAANHLVPAPQVLSQILPLLTHPDTDVSRIVELVSYNQSLTGDVLRICNSACFSGGTPIDNLQYAVTRLGFHQLYEIVVTVLSLMTLARMQEGYGVETRELWEHSVTTAVVARLVAADAQLDQQVAFTAAILHDIGKIILSSALQDARDKAALEAEPDRLAPIEIEMKLLGVNHAEVGGRLLERWKLPTNLVEAVRCHHNPSAAVTNRRLAACVCLGDFLAHLTGCGCGKHSQDLKPRDETLKLLGVSAEKMPEYMNGIFDELIRVRNIYNIE